MSQVSQLRKYTEAMLRQCPEIDSLRYKRAPELAMGHTRITNFPESLVIFLHDMMTCLKSLTARNRAILEAVAVQGYTLAEAAVLMRQSLFHTVRMYATALDELTTMLLRKGLLVIPQQDVMEAAA